MGQALPCTGVASSRCLVYWYRMAACLHAPECMHVPLSATAVCCMWPVCRRPGCEEPPSKRHVSPLRLVSNPPAEAQEAAWVAAWLQR